METPPQRDPVPVPEGPRSARPPYGQAGWEKVML